METIDIFNSLNEFQGTADRKLAHKFGLWHQTFHCWLIKKKGDKIFVMFQKRAETKKDSPNMLDISAAGHLLAGEKKEDGIREVSEELGITFESNNLTYLGIRIEVIEVEGFNNKEFQHVYLLEDNRDIHDYVLQESEVAGLVEVELEQGLKLLNREVESIKSNSVYISNGKKISKEHILTLSQIIPRFDGYYKKIFIMAERYFSGKKYLSI